MADALRAHPLASAALDPARGGKPEQSLFWQDPASGVWLRVRLDWMPDPHSPVRPVVFDYKSTVSAEPGQFTKSVMNFGYPVQAAMYADVYRELTGVDAPFLWIAQEKEAPYLVTVLPQPDADAIRAAGGYSSDAGPGHRGLRRVLGRRRVAWLPRRHPHHQPAAVGAGTRGLLMSTTNGTQLVPHTTPPVAGIGQGTAVEQSRAVAEVEAAVIVAQRMPRDVSRADADMRRSCAQEALAQKAFFRYSRGGSQISGPSVQLARELARCFGNLQYGLVELRRDDDFGQSEMLAFAWDVQTNTRSSTTFIVPHKRDKTGGPVQLTDMRDIYENNANNGARRLREMIFAILPGWYTEAAVAACYETLNGDARDLPERVTKCVDGFGTRGITQKQLESKLGAPRSAWTPGDLATLQVIWRSLMRGEISRDEEFPDAQSAVSAADILAQPQTPAAQADRSAAPPADVSDPTPAPPLHTTQAGKRPHSTNCMLTLTAEGPRHMARTTTWTALYERVIGGTWNGTRSEVQSVTSLLADAIKAAGNDYEAASASLWRQFHADGDDGA